MSPEDAPEQPSREVRIEGMALVIAGLALAAMLGGAFYLGLRVGRGAPSEAASSQTPSAEALDAPPPATPSAGAFDRAADRGSAEPEREVKPSSTQAPATPAPPPPAPGDYFVQVFAGRDRNAAESVLRSLGDRGYPARLEEQRDGADALYKVRVGGYKTQDEARLTAERLKKEGEKGAWVTPAR